MHIICSVIYWLSATKHLQLHSHTECNQKYLSNNILINSIMKLSITLILAILCSTSIALATTYTGTTGDCTYTLDTSDSTLVISGTGAMEDYSTLLDEPWWSYHSYVKTVTIEDGVTSIGDNAFRSCSSLTSITIPNSVTSIGKSAIESCTSLTSVTIPNSVTSIGYCAFYKCTSLSSIIIGSGVTSIGEQAFDYCSSLTSITIPNSVTSIGNWAFYGCTSLTSIIIGSSVTSIGQEAFAECTSLTSVTSLATTPPTCGRDPFSSSTYSSATLYAASTDYATADDWENFTNIVYDTSGNAISSVSASTSAIRTASSAIVITTETAQTAQVYSLAGQLLVKQVVAAGETSIGMPTGGLYVVALADGTKAKVLVK